MTGPGLIVGLTGGIGSGKSAAAAFFARHGAAVIDTDALAHELTAPGGAAMAAIRDTFGAAVIAESGALDRAAMRHLVFNDAVARGRLESILHPLIRAESQLRCERDLAQGAPYAVLVVPLLVESGTYRNRVSRVVVVDCDETTQIARVMARSGMSREEVQRIMAAQASRAERLAAADDTLNNDADISGLELQVAALHRKYLILGAKKPVTG
jgi:dephospho-CoA kinase